MMKYEFFLYKTLILATGLQESHAIHHSITETMGVLSLHHLNRQGWRETITITAKSNVWNCQLISPGKRQESLPRRGQTYLKSPFPLYMYVWADATRSKGEPDQPVPFLRVASGQKPLHLIKLNYITLLYLTEFKNYSSCRRIRGTSSAWFLSLTNFGIWPILLVIIHVAICNNIMSDWPDLQFTAWEITVTSHVHQTFTVTKKQEIAQL